MSGCGKRGERDNTNDETREVGGYIKKHQEGKRRAKDDGGNEGRELTENRTTIGRRVGDVKKGDE